MSSHPTFVCLFPVGLSLLIQRFQQVLWVREETSTPTRPVENVVLTTKGLQEIKQKFWMGRRGKIGKIIN